MCFLADFCLPIVGKRQLKATNILLTLQMNCLDWYESWAEYFRETELDFVLLDIHRPKLQTDTTCEGAKHTTLFITNKRKYGTRKEVTTISPLGMCREEKCV